MAFGFIVCLHCIVEPIAALKRLCIPSISTSLYTVTIQKNARLKRAFSWFNVILCMAFSSLSLSLWLENYENAFLSVELVGSFVRSFRLVSWIGTQHSGIFRLTDHFDTCIISIKINFSETQSGVFFPRVYRFMFLSVIFIFLKNNVHITAALSSARFIRIVHSKFTHSAIQTDKNEFQK